MPSEVYTHIERLKAIKSTEDFNAVAIEVFRWQYQHVSVYHDFIDFLKVDPLKIQAPEQIPFLPIEIFKTQKVLADGLEAEVIFTSSGTTGQQVSKHFVASLELYRWSFMASFLHAYSITDRDFQSDWCVLALLPSYLERDGSSLIYMAESMINATRSNGSGFYLDDHAALMRALNKARLRRKRVLLLGVSFALLDLADSFPLQLDGVIVMETGGMKGKRREMVRQELHADLCSKFSIETIHSEYGMTELLSQAYSQGDGRFTTSPWMKVLIRQTDDPFMLENQGRTGGVNVIDLANLYSCAFIATSDLGRMHPDQRFEILGRFDQSDVRGCNLMIS